jgi:steroid 5-alpha reductase family enzyme
MLDWTIYLLALGLCALIGLGGWLHSLRHDDVSGVDSLWSLMFLAVAATYFLMASNPGGRAVLVLLFVAAWSIRLSWYITRRNHGEGEDHRYQAIRANNEPGFRFKSLYIVYGLQAFLAWFIALPLVAAMSGDAPLGWLDAAGVVLWLTGMFFEVVGDKQLKDFRADAGNKGKVLDTGLWRYTRHPNYFGESVLWWGFFLLAVAAGGWWTILSPLLMTVLLLRVSGVALLEKDIADRRPAYAEYIRRTNAFLPGRPARRQQ